MRWLAYSGFNILLKMKILIFVMDIICPVTSIMKMSTGNNKKTGRSTVIGKCDYCHQTVEFLFCAPSWACFACKVKRGEEQSHTLQTWDECSPHGQLIFVGYLKQLLQFETELSQLFGDQLFQREKDNFNALLNFAKEEDNYYGFGSMREFTLVRFERSTTYLARDFFLTLCIAFDLGNYLNDYARCKKISNEF